MNNKSQTSDINNLEQALRAIQSFEEIELENDSANNSEDWQGDWLETWGDDEEVGEETNLINFEEVETISELREFTYTPLTLQQQWEAIERVAQWLQKHPESEAVRCQYLILVERRGTTQQQEEAIEKVGQWLQEHPQAEIVRQKYLALIEQKQISNQPVSLNEYQNIVNISEWLNHKFEEGWQVIEELLTMPSSLSFGFRNSNVKRAKLIEFKTELSTKTVVLVITVQNEEDEKITVLLDIYPSNDESVLPEGLKCSVISPAGEIRWEGQAIDGRRTLEVELELTHGEGFSVRLYLNGVSVTEDVLI
jgi:hypothetical protein